MRDQKEARERARQRATAIHREACNAADENRVRGSGYFEQLLDREAYIVGYLCSALEQEIYRQELAGVRPQ